MSIELPTGPTYAQTAFTAMQYLPVPVLVLGPLKTVIMANESMGRLMCYDQAANPNWASARDQEASRSATEKLRDQSLSQIGVDLMQDGMPVFVAWENFLDTIGEESKKPLDHVSTPDAGDGGITPTLDHQPQPDHSFTLDKLDRTLVHDVAVDVVLSQQRCAYPADKSRKGVKKSHGDMPQVFASMIISVWWYEDLKHYTLTFVSSQQAPAPTSSPQTTQPSRTTTRIVASASKAYGRSPSSASSVSSDKHSLSPSSGISSPSAYIPTFPPSAPPSRTSMSSAPSLLQKATRLRDALLNAMSIPCYAMWKDKSIGIPNEAFSKMVSFDPTQDTSEFLSGFVMWTEDFTRQLEHDEYPLIKCLKTEQRVSGDRIGLKDPKTGVPSVYDVSCEPIFDSETREFLGGVSVCKDVTQYLDKIAAQQTLTTKVKSTYVQIFDQGLH